MLPENVQKINLYVCYPAGQSKLDLHTHSHKVQILVCHTKDVLPNIAKGVLLCSFCCFQRLASRGCPSCLFLLEQSP